MKRYEISNVCRKIGGLKLNRISDRETRKALIGLHLILWKVDRETGETLNEINRKAFEGHEDEVREYYESRKATPELRALLDTRNELASEYMKSDVEVEFRRIPIDAMVDAIADIGEEWSPNDFAELEPVLE